MKRIGLGVLFFVALWGTLPLQSQPHQSSNSSDDVTPSMPSTEEVNELLSKASEYITQYQSTFKNAKATLDNSPDAGFSEKSNELCSQASSLITAVKKNGPSAYALVGLVGVLDDMSLNAARASSMAIIVGLQQGNPDQQKHAIQDVQDLAQAEKNCYDISELVLHATLRLIAVEEKVLHSISDQQK
jgi:hypothetical protein